MSPRLRLRLATLLLPPLGLVLLWRQPDAGLRRKLLGTLGIVLYSLLYIVGAAALLMQFTPLEIEWRGGFPPVLTFHKTKPDYSLVEAHRSKQTNAPPAVKVEAAGSNYWTDFRGPNRDGHYAERTIRTNWPAVGLKEFWRQPIGGGYASFVVADGRAFTIEQRRDEEAVTAYDVATGLELWAHRYPALFREEMGGEGPRATPTWHGGRLYSLGAQGELCCLDAVTGRVIWRKNILNEFNATGLYFGLSASPLVVDEKLIVMSGEPLAPVKGMTNFGVLALNKQTGAKLWAALPEKAAYASPMLVTLAGERQILVNGARRVAGLRPSDGALLWEIPWRVQYDNAIAQPVLVSSNRFMLSAGYGGGSALVEVSRSGEGFSARQVWKNLNLKNKFNSSVFHEGFLYGLDEGILTCLDANTGVRRWKDGRYGYGQMLLASGHLVILGGEGDLALVQATPERHVELARFPALKGKTWNHPTIAGGRLFVRNAVEMACYDLSAP